MKTTVSFADAGKIATAAFAHNPPSIALLWTVCRNQIKRTGTLDFTTTAYLTERLGDVKRTQQFVTAIRATLKGSAA